MLRALQSLKMREAQLSTRKVAPVCPGGNVILFDLGYVDGCLLLAAVFLMEVRLCSASTGVTAALTARVSLAATVSPTPHLENVGQSGSVQPTPQTDSRVLILEVEHAIRDACDCGRFRAIAADRYRWQCSRAVPEAEGLPVGGVQPVA